MSANRANLIKKWFIDNFTRAWLNYNSSRITRTLQKQFIRFHFLFPFNDRIHSLACNTPTDTAEFCSNCFKSIKFGVWGPFYIRNFDRGGAKNG